MNKKDAEAIIKDTIEYANNEIKKNRARSRRVVFVSAASAALVVLICVIAYFYPMSLSDTVRTNKRIDMILNQYEIKEGNPNIESVIYNDISEKQKEAIIALLEDFDYSRTGSTLFSNGTLTDLADQTLTIFVYDDHSSVAAIVVASSGKMAINDRSYSCKNADQLIDQIIEILQTEY